MTGCIKALDWLPGCSWPMWLQLLVGFAGFVVVMLILPRPWGWRTRA